MLEKLQPKVDCLHDRKCPPTVPSMQSQDRKSNSNDLFFVTNNTNNGDNNGFLRPNNNKTQQQLTESERMMRSSDDLPSSSSSIIISNGVCINTDMSSNRLHSESISKTNTLTKIHCESVPSRKRPGDCDQNSGGLKDLGAD